MNCTINDLNLSFDKDNRLRTTIGRVTKSDVNKAYVLASFFQDDNFKKFLTKHLTKEDVLNPDIDLSNIKEEDFVNIKQNKLGALLNVYYLDNFHSVANSKTNRGSGSLSGFTTASAKSTAKIYNANLIIDEYYEEMKKPHKKQDNIAMIVLNRVDSKIMDTFYKRTDDFATNIVTTGKYSKEAVEYANKYLETVNEIKENKDRLDELNRQIEKNKTTAKEKGELCKKEKNENARKSLEQEIKDLKQETIDINKKIKAIKSNLAIHKNNRYIIAQNLINLYTDNVDGRLKTTLRNYANLVSQIRGDRDGWYFQVFNTKTMTSIIRNFNNIGEIEEYIEEPDENTDTVISKYNGENVDETAKTWEDNLYKSHTQAISRKLKNKLATIKKYNQRYNPNDVNQGIDTENELGVDTYMDYGFISVQLFSFGNFNNVESFIKSIELKSQSIKSLYGLGALVEEMKNDPVFANEVFANFAKPIIDKTILNINDFYSEDGFEFDISNTNARPLTEMVFRISNKIKATYNSNYNINDAINLRKLVNDFNENKITIIKLKEDLYKIISNYIPALNKDIYNNYFDNNENNIHDRIKNLTDSFEKILTGINSLKNDINKEIAKNDADYKEELEKWKKDIKEWQSAKPKDRGERPIPPTYKYIDYHSRDLTASIYKGIFNFSRELIEYTEARVRLNSTNAEGNQASDVIKNCFVTRFFEQIMAESEEDSNKGLKNLLTYLTQGDNHGLNNQYANNPLFFGLKDINGNIIKKGMFSWNGTHYSINQEAKHILKLTLFDGVKSGNEDGAGYANMTKLDYFITEYIVFDKSVKTLENNSYSKKVGNINTGVYSMRIPSDAPKMFFIRAPKYTDNEATLAIYNHVMNELNMLCNGLNSIFTEENNKIVTTTSIKKLIGRAFFNEKTAEKINSKKGIDFTKAIVENGKLTGNLFKLNRLFVTNGYNANTEIESILSLYGGSNNGGLIIPYENGRLQINKDFINNTNYPITYINGKFILNLNNTQKEQIKNIVDKWVEIFLDESNIIIEPYLKTMKEWGISYDDNSIKNFFLNTANMNMCYDDLFEGDYKYYTGDRDFFKRTKEVQAGGDGYSGYNLLDENDTEIRDLEWQGKPQYINVKQNVNGRLQPLNVPAYESTGIINKPMTARNGWRGVTIYNTVKASDYAVKIQELLEKIFIKDGMSEEKAKKRSILTAKGYGYNAAEISGDKTKINDAQSYITLEEFIRRKHADGTINEYQDLLAQLLDPNVSAEEIDLEEVNARIQVQKNFYYDKIYDKDTGIYYPRQIKNAEFVLIPKLLPEGFELRKVYDWMIANDIGQLNTAETSKAAKKSILTIWDISNGDFNENFEEDFDESYIENYKYQYLYKQQDVPQHLVDERNKAGVQIMKKIIDNIIGNPNVSDEIKRYAKEFQDAYAANIEDSFEILLDKFGWEYDVENNKIVNSEYPTEDINGKPLPDDVIKNNRETLNFTYFWQLAREEAARVGRDSNFMEFLIPNEFGDITMPNYMSNVQNSLESIAQSIYNGTVTRQTLPGWHAAQITGVGYSKKLKFDVETGTMEVYLPRWSSLIPKGKNAEEDAQILKQIEEEGLDIHLGYRIPTEGKQSIAILKVVGFTNDCLGSTIVVPDDWVTQTGSDFDVDSVYGISWEMYKEVKDGKITLHKIPFEEGTVNDENLYIQYVQNRLENKVKKTKIGSEIKSSIDKVKDEILNKGLSIVSEKNEEYNKLDELRNELFNELPKWARGIIKDENSKHKKVNENNVSITDIKEAYPIIINKFNDYLNKHKLSEDDTKLINEYIDYSKSLLEIMNYQEGIVVFNKEEYKSEKSKIIQELIEKAKKEYFNKIQEEAKNNSLISFEEFKELDHVKKLSRKARNNYILDRMIKIMKDESSREEQYVRSNFDDLNAANKKINDISGESSRIRSPYNVLDHLDYFEDAQSGAKLKARSVLWDTFISKNNKLRCELPDEHAIEVILDVDDKSAKDSDIIYNEDDIRNSYGKDIEDYIEEKIKIVVEDLPYVISIDMSFNYENEKRNDIKSTSTIEAIERGERTATTRYLRGGKNANYLKELDKLKIGDIVQFKNKDGKKVYAKITKPLTKLSKNINAEEWSKKEGWSIEHFNKKVKPEIDKGEAYQFEYEYVNNKKEIKNKPQDKPKKQLLFKARKIGFSNDNRNITGDLITPYTSQTTAHHLDAIKMGSIPNVDEYTFNVYKLLSSVGLDYETVIGFIRQPAIRSIVSNNNLINSIFVKDDNDPIKMAIIDIAKSLDIKLNKDKQLNYHDNLNKVIDALKTDMNFSIAFNELFGINITKLDNKSIFKIKVPINKNKLFTRIKRENQHKGDKYENLAFDFAMILNFKNYKYTADKIEDCIKITNADKFGALQTIHDTREIFDKVVKLRNETNPILSRDGKSLVDIIYPLLDSNDEYSIDVENSEYKPIAAIYKYATLASLINNKELFITENDDFDFAIKQLQKAIGHKFTSAEHSEFKKYMMNYLYNGLEKLLIPLTIDKRGRLKYNSSLINDSENKLKTAKSFWNSERNRICGYGVLTDGEIKINDINNPTNEEIEEYNKLTPAQKVLFIQKNFGDDQGIFNYIKITLFNPNDIKLKGITRQYLSYDDQVDDIENLFKLFEDSFYNRNPLIKLAAIDLVKYAFIGENFNFKSGYITKLIRNNAFYNSIEDGGFDIIKDIKNEINYMPNTILDETFIEMYVRSHHNIIVPIKLYPDENKYLNTITATSIDGIIHFDITNENKTNQKLINHLKLVNKVGKYIKITRTGINKYKKQQTTTNLYKVVGKNFSHTENDIDYYCDYFLMPINTLDRNEAYEYSYNQNNNKHNSKDYYIDKINLRGKIANSARKKLGDKKTENQIVYRSAFVSKPEIDKVSDYIVKNNIDFEDNYLFMKLYNSGDEMLKGGVRKLLNGIVEHIEKVEDGINIPYVQYNPNFKLNQILPQGVSIDQTIELNNGDTINITITHQTITEKLIKSLENNRKTPENLEEYKEAIEDLNAGNVSTKVFKYAKNIHLYRITKTKQTNEEIKETIRKAATDLILEGDEIIETTPIFDDYSARRDDLYSDVAFDIAKEINYENRKTPNGLNERFIKEINKKHININLQSSIDENIEDVYKHAALYYQSKSSYLNRQLDRYILGGIEYSMDNPELFDKLIEYDEYFNNITNIILEGLTFGNRISDIFNLDIKTEDEQTKRNIESIKHSINSVRTNKKLKDALNNLINIYFKKFSTNPRINMEYENPINAEITRDLINLRETFGDLEALDAWIADPAEAPNNEVQVILKQVYKIITKAELFDAKRNVEEYKEKLAAIENEYSDIDINKVIDFDTFSLRQDYNKRYLEDRQKIQDEYNEAFAKRSNSYEDFVNYVNVKFKRDEFIHKHQEQYIIPEYYNELLSLQRNMINSSAKDVYYKYLYLQHQLYSINENLVETDEETANRKRNIKAQINQLKSEFDILENLKPDTELIKIKKLKNYIEGRKNLSEKYFDKQEHEGFREIYIKYKNYIDNYNRRHPNETLDEKLNDIDYYEAYTWIKNNGHIGFSKEMRDELSKAFKILTKRNSVLSNSTKLKLKSVPGAIDENGNIDPTKLSDEQIDNIREEESNELSKMYDEGLGESMLIKIIPDDIPIIRTSTKNKETNSILNDLKFKDNARKTIIIKEINDILKKTIDFNSGKINIQLLFNDEYVTNEERNTLYKLYEELRELRNNPKSFKKKNSVFEYKTNDTEFYTALSYYNTKLKNTAQGKQFLRIFTEIDAEGNLVPNSLLYGYLEPKDNFIDTEKTKARDFINKNVDFVETEKYYESIKDALAKGTEYYNEWFKRNHIYNPYTHNYQPLKIWTRLEAKPNSQLANSVDYIASDDNMEYFIKPEYRNKKYKKDKLNYRKGDILYDNPIKLNTGEIVLRDYLSEVINDYASTYQGKKFASKGFLPRQREIKKDTRWAISQAGALFGINWHSKTESDAFRNEVNYTTDKEADFDMLSLIKAKGTRKYEPLPSKIGKTEEEYNKELKEVRERNRLITEENLKIDNANVNKNWREVMEAYIHNATIFNARQSTKPLFYLLIEDLAVNNAYMLKGMVNKDLVKASSPSDNTRYKKVEQINMQKVIHNQARRIIYEQYNEKSLPRTIANVMQNMTSAKYMVFNGYGGIANVAIGKTNINMEIAANEYFGFAEFTKAEQQYLMNTVPMIASVYSENAPNITVGLIKYFNIVNFDDLNQFSSGSDNVEENLKRARNFLYSFQSIGEHYMHNSVLLAMLKSNRLYVDSKGVKRIGDFKDFTWDLENKAMQEIVNSNPDLVIAYQRFLTAIKHDSKLKLDLETGRKDLNREFLYTLRDNTNKETQKLYKDIAEKYNTKRKELLEKESKEFYKNPTIESLFEFKNNKVSLKQSEIDKFNKDGKNSIGDLESLIAEFKNKVIAVNKKIHGVYDKNGAAMLEQKWLGSVIMQYHKHLWTGVMKHYRRRGYYSEFRGSRERGIYQDLIDFMGTEFANFNSRVKNKADDGENIILASIQVLMQSALNSITNIQFNWNNLSRWEQANIKRNLAEISKVIAVCLLVMALYGMNDDDEIKDSRFKSSLLYLADRIYTDATLYTPIGAISEYKTLWSSPIASANGPSDLFKAITIIPQLIFDPEFERTYKTGRYAGQDKLYVLFRRNMPGMRPLYQYLDITRSTEYYKVGQSQIGINVSKRFGEMINDL